MKNNFITYKRYVGGLRATKCLLSIGKVSRFFLLVTVASLSCSDFVENAALPQNQIVRQTVFADPQAAGAAIRGIYSEMISPAGAFSNGGLSSVTVLAATSADEMVNYAPEADAGEFYENALSPTNSTVTSLWAAAFKYIYYANSVLEGLQRSTLAGPVKSQLSAEARFIRAFCYFYLVNLFGDVPFLETTDYSVNRLAQRLPARQINEHIIADLKMAETMLASDYSVSDGQRVRPNQYAAKALLARVYLYTGQWALAEVKSTEVINNEAYELPADLNTVFLSTSKEAIWQLLPVSTLENTLEGSLFILTSTPRQVAMSQTLSRAFKPGDKRFQLWTDSITVADQVYRFAYKYKIKNLPTPKSEYSMVLRLAEQYLIRAEARARLGELRSATADLDLIRQRAGLSSVSQTDTKLSQQLVLELIFQERQTELFTEWGHRWLDLNRTNLADQVLGPVKPHWQKGRELFPIPKTEIDNNPNLVQNTGY